MRGGVEMREIRHKPGVHSEKPREFNRREFFRVGGGGLLAGLAATSCVGSLIFPTRAHAEAERRTPRTITLDRPLAELDRATQPYRQPESFPNDSIPQYSNSVVVPADVGFLVAINNREDRRGLNITLGSSREPLRADLNAFARVVRDTSRQALNRVRIILDRGSEQVDGREVEYTNAYILPIDAQGNATTGLGEGRYLIYGASKSGDRVGGAATYILQEPENRHTVAVLQR